MGEELKEELKEGEGARRIISWTGVQPNGGRKKGVTVMRVPEQCGSQGFWEFAYTSLGFPRLSAKTFFPSISITGGSTTIGSLHGCIMQKYIDALDI